MLKLVTAVTWLFAPIAGMMAVGVPATISFLAGSSGYDQLLPLTLLMLAVLVLWLCLAWTVGHAHAGRARRIHIAVSLGLAVLGAGGPMLLSFAERRPIEETTVTRVLPPS